MTKRAAGRIERQCPGCGNGTAGMGGGWRYCPCGWTDKPMELRRKKRDGVKPDAEIKPEPAPEPASM